MPQKQNNPKHYLVTGGCGFIGSHLVDVLIDSGHIVTIFDDLSTGKRENANPEANLVIGNTVDYSKLAQEFSDIDGCFHLAAIASVEKCTKEWVESHMVNVVSTINVFQAASQQNKRIPVVYTSSAAVYGNSPVVPIPEHVVCQPLTAYGADKYACDLQGRVAWTVHGVPNIGVRPFNIYGPRQDPKSPYSGVISIFMDRLLRGLPITIYGDGGQLRDFVYVEDAVKVFTTSMEKLHMATYAGHEVVNSCTGQPTSINELAQIISSFTNHLPDYKYAMARTGDIRVSIGDPARLNSWLGIKLKTTLEEGLSRMIAHGIFPQLPIEEQRSRMVS